MKRFIFLVAAITLLLSGCAGNAVSNPPASDPQLISADTLLTLLLSAVPEGSEAPSILSGEELDACLLIYGIDSSLVQNCAVARLGASRVFELAVIDLAVPSYTVEDALLTYLRQRQGDFTGYAPDQAEIAANGKLFAVEGDFRLVLALTEDTSAVSHALFDTGYTEVTEICEARQPKKQPSPSPEQEETTAKIPSAETTFSLPRGWYPYTDPRTDDMSTYQTSAILSAWKSETPESLSKKDRQLYDRCAAIIAQCITEEMADCEKELAIYRWLTWNVAYDWRHQDHTLQTPRDSYTPYGALVKGEAVCLGFATAFQLLMDILDIECITVVGAAFHSSENHAWNMVRLDGKWYCVDATWDMGKSPEHYDYFNVTSDHMAKSDHQWDYPNTPMATAIP